MAQMVKLHLITGRSLVLRSAPASHVEVSVKQDTEPIITVHAVSLVGECVLSKC